MPPQTHEPHAEPSPYHGLQQGPADVYRTKHTAKGWVVVSAKGKQVFGPEPDEAAVIRAFRTDPDYGEALALLSDNT
jgi:hypothetical protein